MFTEIINKWGFPQLVETAEGGNSPVEVLAERDRRSNFLDFQNTNSAVCELEHCDSLLGAEA